MIASLFHQLVWLPIIVLWILLYIDYSNLNNIRFFIDTVLTIKYVTVYSGYWVMVLLILFSVAILPRMNLGFFTFVDGNLRSSKNYEWIGWATWALYTAYVIMDTAI